MEWKWNLSDLDKVEKNGIKVFTCFSCGGGSSMGYKLAGCDVLGNVEIDKAMNKLYVKNHSPKYNFNMDIREFKKIPDEELPEELFDLDILDGSPPCTSFTTNKTSKRHGDWGKSKKFAEGQALQTLDDLFFEFIDVAEKLRPKVIIAENVTGLMFGRARGFVREIIQKYDNAGYDTQIFKLNSALMGVPQVRERIFFISRRKDLHLPKIHFNFNEKPVTYGEVESHLKEKYGKPLMPVMRKWFYKVKAGDRVAEYHPKRSYFNFRKVHKNQPVYTINASANGFMHYKEPYFIPEKAFIGLQTFPQDYDFMGQNITYVCGMSVPPVMMKKIASSVIEQLF